MSVVIAPDPSAGSQSADRAAAAIAAGLARELQLESPAARVVPRALPGDGAR